MIVLQNLARSVVVRDSQTFILSGDPVKNQTGPLLPHRSLDKDAPVYHPIQRTGSITSRTILGGLHQHYVRV
jgi:hypothetical protein